MSCTRATASSIFASLEKNIRLSAFALASLVAIIAVAPASAKEPAVVTKPAPAPAPPEARNLKLASMFSDHMVLQRDMKVPVWGHAKPSAKVEVKFDAISKETTADADGN